MNEEKKKAVSGDEEKVSGVAASQEERKIDRGEGVDVMLFHMICPPGIGGRGGKVE